MPTLNSTSFSLADPTLDIQAAQRIAVHAARENLLSFILLFDPEFSLGPHHHLIAAELLKLDLTPSGRLMLATPPRASKSLMASTYYAAWSIGRHPDWKLMAISHNVDLATKFGRAVRDIVTSPLFAIIFPECRIKKDNRAADSWATEAGGEYMAAGAGGGIAGYGANLAILDDVLSEQDAFSAAARRRLHDWYPGGLRSRLMPGGRIAIINTRWHEEDLSGWLLAQQKENPFADHWRVINIQALTTPETAALLNTHVAEMKAKGLIPLSYPEVVIDESFWPAATNSNGFHWSTEMLRKTKENTPPYQWEALYMQNPTSPEGGILRVNAWKNWEKDTPPTLDHVLISIDSAFSTRSTADFSAITVWGIFKDLDRTPRILLLGAEKGRWDFPTLRRKVHERIAKNNPDFILVEKKASGQSLIQELRLGGAPVTEFQPDRDKVSRAHAVTPYFQNGQVYAPISKPWARDVIEECRSFPGGAHDDYVDTVTQTLLWFRNIGQLTSDGPWHRLDEDAIMNSRTTRRYY